MQHMPVFDLHAHSTRSDGVLSPRELVTRASARGVTVLALTDHDDTSGLDEARTHARAAGLGFVNGVEISVTWNGETLHVVGLQVDPHAPELAAGLARIRSGRDRRAEGMAASLARVGIPGCLDGARRYVTNPALVGRAHFARYLVERGHARDLASVFKKYLSYGNPGYVPHQWATLGEAVRWIVGAGGIAVLAHPGRYRLAPAQREALLESFKAVGGSAIEVVTGSHTRDQYATWGRYARRFGLDASMGSDFHGPGESARDLGSLPPLPQGCRPVWQAF